MRLWIDTETRGPNFALGLARYALTVEVIMIQWAVDDGPVHVEDLTVGAPSAALIKAATKADELWFHECAFDRTVLETTDWWPKFPLTKYRCTGALALMHGLPKGLDKLCQIFKVKDNEAKHTEGKSLIQLFCKPRSDGGYNDRHSHPIEWEKFLGYGGSDISAMRAVWRSCPKWNATPRLWAGWHLNERMNMRGVGVDLELCQGAKELTEIAKKRMGDRTEELSLGEVERTTQVARLRAFCAEYGVHLPDLTADTVERRLEDESLTRIHQGTTACQTASI